MADQGIASLATGLSQGLNSYLGSQIQSQQNVNEYAQKKAIDQQYADKGGDSDPVLSPEMAETVLPGHGASMVNQYNQQNPNRPLKLSQGVQYLKTAADALAGPDTSKDQNHQDQLEKQAMDRLTQVRGDTSIQRAEAQRDAAGMAYDTIAKAQSEGRDLSQIEYLDTLGQLWKVRTGQSPTDQIVQELRQKTAKEGINRAITFASGNPNLVGATTTDTLNNLKQFVQASGSKADQQHEAYMSPRLIKPTGLEDERWNHIVGANRGISFKDQMSVSDRTYKGQAQDIESKRAALRAKLGL